MSKHHELRVLKHEEQVLIKLFTKLNDQLTRLKVEELALQSKMRLEVEAAAGLSNTHGDADHQPAISLEEADELAEKAQPILDLSTAMGRQEFRMDVEEEEEEEEEEDIRQDDLTAFLAQLEEVEGRGSR